MAIITSCNLMSYKDESFELPSNSEINEVIHSVLEQDSNYNFRTEFTSIELPKTIVHFRTKQNKEKRIKPVIFPSYGVNVNSLIGYGMTTEELLKISDSLFFERQNKTPNKTLLDTKIFQGYRILTMDSMIKYYSKKNFYYIQFGTPVFTANKEYVYLKSNIICTGLCGEGRVYILKKLKNKWILYQSIRTWVG